MAHKIESKIVGWRIKANDPPPPPVVEDKKPALEKMHEALKRPHALTGTTYKLNPPNTPHSLYITISDIVLNKGTEHERLHPYEIFINSKNMDSYPWIIALTRLMSAVFRKGGDVAFMVEELKSVFDPRGGYFEKKTYIPSVIAHIGHIVERHLKHTRFIAETDPTAEQRAMMKKILAEKEFELRDKASEIEFPEKATMCPHCSTKAMIIMDGCATCLSCAYSKCG